MVLSFELTRIYMYMFGMLTELTGHRDDFALERTFRDIPLSLIDHERRLSVIFRILICLRDDPRGEIRSSLRQNYNQQLLSTSTDRVANQIKHFPGGD